MIFLPEHHPSNRVRITLPIVLLISMSWVSSARAGMPDPLRSVINSAIVSRRLEEISFFIILFVLMTFLVWYLWNQAAREMPVLPKLSLKATAGMLLLWGMFGTLILTLVSGARELMTPGAWEPNGVTFKLKQPANTVTIDNRSDDIHARIERLQLIYQKLRRFADAHDGNFPDAKTAILQLGEGLMEGDAETGLHYDVVVGRSIKQPVSELLIEPNTLPTRLSLLTDGSIQVYRPKLRSATTPPSSKNASEATPP